MIITLCGTTKFMDSFHKYNKHLTLAGHVIFSVSTSVKGDWKPTEDEKRTLDLIHLAKIDASDAVFVIDREFGLTGKPETYIGDSTLNEIRYAAIKEKQIYYASEHHARHLLYKITPSRAIFAQGFDKSNDCKS